MHRVMIVEDEILVRTGLRTILDWSKLGLEVQSDASDGVEAYEIYRELRPDIIVTDLRMPRMDGMELIRKIREEDHRTRFVILTCVEELELARKAIELGVDGYILKLSMTPDEMESVLRGAVERLKDLTACGYPEPKALGSGPNRKRRDELFKQYLVDKTMSTSDFLQSMSASGFALVGRRIILVCMKIDHCFLMSADRRADGANPTEETIFAITESIAKKYRDVCVTRLRPAEYLLCFTSPPGTEQRGGSQAYKDVLQNIRSSLKRYFGLTMSCGVSRETTAAHSMQDAFAEAFAALEYRLYTGTGTTNTWDQRAFLSSVRAKYADLLEAPGQLATLGCTEEYLKRVRGLASRGPVDPDTMRGFFVHLLQMTALFSHADKVVFEDLVIRYGDVLQRCETMQELRRAYGEFLDDAVAQGRRSIPYSRHVAAAIEHLQEHFAEEISLQRIADVAGVSPAYFSALFKREVNMSFSAYLTSFRIAKAEEMLLNTDLLSYEVSERAGFSDAAHFSRTFKKSTGVSPSDFRKRWKARLPSDRG